MSRASTCLVNLVSRSDFEHSDSVLRRPHTLSDRSDILKTELMEAEQIETIHVFHVKASNPVLPECDVVPYELIRKVKLVVCWDQDWSSTETARALFVQTQTLMLAFTSAIDTRLELRLRLLQGSEEVAYARSEVPPRERNAPFLPTDILFPRIKDLCLIIFNPESAYRLRNTSH